MFQAIFVKVDEFGWWGMQRTQVDTGMQFKSKKFSEYLSVRGVKIVLAAPDHQEMNVQVEVK